MKNGSINPVAVVTGALALPLVVRSLNGRFFAPKEGMQVSDAELKARYAKAGVLSAVVAGSALAGSAYASGTPKALLLGGGLTTAILALMIGADALIPDSA